VTGEGWLHDVLRFWFEETTPPQWFQKDGAFDALVRQRFLALHEHLAEQPEEMFLVHWSAALAGVVVFDQMSRNMFRGTARAFATDAKALRIADNAIAKGFDDGLTKDQRMFLYLPFEHAEDRAMQERSVALMTALGDPEQTKWAELHKVVIDRFGRFPHRNIALGRPSTPEEIEFLKQPNSSF
jgi:uncharacterized protein (DUF924 family)